jgi:dienelactone hydrolase
MACMANVALFHSVLGIRAGVLDAADRMRADGHEVIVADLFDGRTFDDYEPAIQFAEGELGHRALMQRAEEAVAEVPDGFVTFGFSLGCVLAAYLVTVRPVSGVVMAAGAIPVSAFGPGARWPRGVPAQTHSTLDDPWREQDALDQAVLDVTGAGGTLEVFDYPGRGHLFTDASLPEEYDAAATALFWSRVLPFLRAER